MIYMFMYTKSDASAKILHKYLPDKDALQMHAL
jgi:hypothetical protein